MRRVTLTDHGQSKSFMIGDSDTPYQILQHCSIVPETKLVYLNGQLIPNQKMKSPIKTQGAIFLAVQDKTIMRN